jgi:hypothetical protein
VVGGTGADVVTLVSTGANTISINDATTSITGGTGIDTVTFVTTNTTAATVVGGAGADVITMTASGANALSVNDATTSVTGGGGIDTITFVTTVATAVTVAGGVGADVIALVTGTNAGVVINDTDGFALTGGTINTVDFSGGALTATSITGGSGVDTYTFGTGSNVATVTGGGGIDVIDAGASHTGGLTFITGSTAAAADLITNFVSSGTVDKVDLSAALTAATLTVGTQLAAGAAASAAAAIIIVDTAADTDAEVYYIENTAGADGELTLTQIETAITAGNAATGQVTVIVDNGTSTFVYTDSAAETDAGSGTGLILQVTLVGITGSTAVATGDFVST